MRLSFIIVEYNSIEDVIACYSSIEVCRFPDLLVEVVVSSNSNYTSEEQQKLGTEYPQLKWIFNPKNGGFAYAMNQGLKNTSGDILVIMNPDVRLKQGIDIMVNYLWNHIGVGLVAPMICNNIGEIQDSFRHFITPVGFLSRHLKRLFCNDKVYPISIPMEVDWVCGAFMMMSRQSFETVGGLDEHYFLYCEDMDLCKRMHQKGYSVVYYPKATIEYEGTRSARRSWKYARIFLKSLLRYWIKFGFH